MPRFWRKKSKPIAERIQEHHKEFAARIIKQIKEGVAPWQKPWKPGEKFLPENFKSGNAYRGTNTLNLASVAIERGYSDHRWGTYKQIKAAGGYVRSGEKGSRIVYVSTHRTSAVKDDQGQPVKDKEGRQVYEKVPRTKPFPKHYTVFNVEQAEGLNLPEIPEAKPSWEAHDAAERVIRASGVDFRHERGDRAVYQPGPDRVVMPPREQFGDAGHYYRTALHEVAHATGHPRPDEPAIAPRRRQSGSRLPELRPRGTPGRDQLHDDQHRTRHRPRIPARRGLCLKLGPGSRRTSQRDRRGRPRRSGHERLHAGAGPGNRRKGQGASEIGPCGRFERTGDPAGQDRAGAGRVPQRRAHRHRHSPPPPRMAPPNSTGGTPNSITTL